MKAFLGLVALLGLSYMMADKEKIPEATKRMNVWARSLAFFTVGGVLLFFFGHRLF